MIGKLDRRVILGTAAGLVVVLLAWYLLLWRTEQSNISTWKSNYSNAQALLAKAIASYHNALGGTGAASAAAHFGLLNQAIPSAVDLAGILNDVYTAATLAGVPVSSITPAAPNAGGSASSASNGTQQEHLTISTSGRYFQIVDFVDQLQRLPRIFVITSLTISGGTPQQPVSPSTLFTPDLTASIAATTFYTGSAPSSVAASGSVSTATSTTVVPGSTTIAPQMTTTTTPSSTATSVPSATTILGGG